MPDSQPKHIAQLDGIRCFAVVFVLIDHWLGSKNILPLGYFGVNLFFVLSGFLITTILLRNKTDIDNGKANIFNTLKTFIVRRSLRIFPAYFALIFVLVILNVNPVRQHFFWYISYTTNFLINLQNGWLGNSDHLWSLAVEEQFYLFFPLIIILCPKKRIPMALILALLVSFLYRFSIVISHDSWIKAFVSTVSCLDTFAMGALLTYVRTYNNEQFAKLTKPSFVLAIFSFISLTFFIIFNYFNNTPRPNWGTDLFQRTFFSIIGCWAITQAVVGFKGIGKQILENNFVQYIGKISYGIYLYHNFIFNAYYPDFNPYTNFIINLFPENIFIHLLVCLTLTISLASVSWYCLEKPINNLKKHFEY